MTAARSKGSVEPRITIDDMRMRAEHIRDMAQDEVKRVVEADVTKYVLYGAVAVAVIVSVAFLVGTRAGRRRA